MIYIYASLACLLLIIGMAFISARHRSKQNETPRLDEQIFERREQP